MKLFKSKSFIENFSWTFIGSTIYAISQWLLIVVLAKFGSAEAVGQFTLGLAVTAPIILFFNMQFRNILATDSEEEYSFSEYIGTRIILLLFSFIIVLIVVVLGPYNPSVSLVIILVSISKVIESMSELTHGFFQKRERMDYAGKSLIVKAISSLLAFSLPFIIFNSVILGLIGLIIAWLFRLILYDLKNIKKYTTIKPTFKGSKSLILFAFPLGLVSIINSLNTNIPRYFLERTVGIEELGYFAAIAYILVAGNLLIRPVSLVIAPRLAKSYNENDKRKYLKITLSSLMLAFIIGLIILGIVYFYGELILTVMYNSTYANYNNVFIIIMIGSIISYFTTFLNTSIVAARSFKKQPYINMLTMLVAVITSITLIPLYGVEGAAYVMMLVFVTQFIGSLGLFIMTFKKSEE